MLKLLEIEIIDKENPKFSIKEYLEYIEHIAYIFNLKINLKDIDNEKQTNRG